MLVYSTRKMVLGTPKSFKLRPKVFFSFDIKCWVHLASPKHVWDKTQKVRFRTKEELLKDLLCPTWRRQLYSLTHYEIVNTFNDDSGEISHLCCFTLEILPLCWSSNFVTQVHITSVFQNNFYQKISSLKF